MKEKLFFNKNRNMIEVHNYTHKLQDVDDPQLFRDIFEYGEIPKIAFNFTNVPMFSPEEIWITDTTFRDGQQSQSPFSVSEIVDLYSLMSKLGGPNGKIRQCEFFIYSEKDREAVRKCQDLGLPFPEVTSWIRASEKDFKLVKDMDLKETGILVSCSDYHIFKKMNITRRQAMDKYLSIVKEALNVGIRPRCHFEDITRADFYGFVVPFAAALKDLMDESGIPIKIRACDTLGYGVAFPGAAMPRSVPGIIYGLHHYADFPSELLEWHGHNDFYKVVNNATTAWLYGASAVNCSLLGIGERTGNCPLEAMAIEYVSIRGTSDGMDLTMITEIANYFENKIGYVIPARTPFVGRNFNLTRAGIHADGMLKDQEIYNIFDTERILNRCPVVAVDSHSGSAGIAYWINGFFKLGNANKIHKNDELVTSIKALVDNEYANGRNTSMSDEELLSMIKKINQKKFKEFLSSANN
jgi:isopropylmalate/homocitrate/citramalate synthase